MTGTTALTIAVGVVVLFALAVLTGKALKRVSARYPATDEQGGS